MNVYIVFDLDPWSRNPTKNFKFKNCLFEATDVVRNSDKEKYVYSGYEITFESAGSWGFDNDFARNIIIFDNRRNNFLKLGEGPTYVINGSFGSPEKDSSIIFTKANTNFCLSLHYNVDNSFLFVNGKKKLNLKLTIKLLTFQPDFV